uniref:ATP-dependent zinc metalloprotease FtsH n=1 Tax=Olisthodiscus luteus TaxID=83000 RepID=A0A7U0KSW5_OLILU|nr:cell division protein FTSH [Olisthodiscus luteus]YP_010152847.1 cell division protein FTSH [Olisthodiscus luteus]QQW50444.1 cell division protein FTSH [Olisthodiscus luteus]QQW50508.1 cell division protein FTSH [Olisthodiscus luteus]
MIVHNLFNSALFIAENNLNVPKNDYTTVRRLTPYGNFLNYLEKGQIKKVDVLRKENLIQAEFADPNVGNRLQTLTTEMPPSDNIAELFSLTSKLENAKVDFAMIDKKNTLDIVVENKEKIELIALIVLNLFLLEYSYGFLTMLSSQLGQKVFGAESETKERKLAEFQSIAGIDEAKGELTEVVEIIKTSESSDSYFRKLGARTPKGVLLIGPPGTGKTLLAKAVASEANMSFELLPGSQFVELFVGVGAGRVRDLFNRAKKKAPCVIFIDEIDAVGKKRGSGYGNDEREQTLNQLLIEMDGFESNKGIIVLAATNRVDVLDSALLRPGRFDRQVYVGLPDVKGRLEILKVHAKNKIFSPDISLDVIAKLTPNFAGADLENLLNESAILAARAKKTVIGRTEIQTALEKIITGLESGLLAEGKVKLLLAYHEIGHAIAATLLKNHEHVDKVTLVPRGNAKGLTWFQQEESESLLSREQLLARIIVALSGRAAEEVIFGKSELTTGANADLRQVKEIATSMVRRFGMSQLGPRSFDLRSKPSFLRPIYSEETLYKIDEQIQLIATTCYIQALNLIKANRIIISILVEKLIKFETIDGESFRSIVNDFTPIPSNADYSYVYDKK